MPDDAAEVRPELEPLLVQPKYLEIHTIVCPGMPGLAIQVATAIAPQVAEELHLDEGFAQAAKERMRKIILAPHGQNNRVS